MSPTPDDYARPMRIERPGFLIHGAISLEYGDGWVRPWRLPHRARVLFPSPDDALFTRAEKTSGVRLQFQTDATTVRLVLDYEQEAESDTTTFDLTQGDAILSDASWEPGMSLLELDLGGSAGQMYELWLPTFGAVRIRAVEFDGASFLDPGSDERPRWLTYGSSITHCRGASSPARSWPATAARAHGLHLISLGFGGQCHLDGMVARVIRDQPMDLLTLKLGINVYGNGSLNVRSYEPAVIAFIQTIRDRHPSVPIGVITPIWASTQEPIPNALGMTLNDYREADERVVQTLKEFGDANIHCFDGRDLLGEAEAELLADEVHPDSEGYEMMGRRVTEKVLPVLLRSRYRYSEFG